LNHAIAHYPLETVVSLAVLEGLSFTLTKYGLLWQDVHFPILFAAAYVISIPLRRSVIPKLCVALPMAVVLRFLVPSLARVHISNLWRTRHTWMPTWLQRSGARPIIPTPAITTATVAPSKGDVSSSPASFVTRWRRRLTGPLESLSDHYGLSLFISYRLAGCVLVNAVYYALLKGMDVTPILEFAQNHFASWVPGLSNHSDVSAKSKSVVGAYAAAVVYGALWFPLTVFLAPFPAKLMWRVRQLVVSRTLGKVAAAAPVTTAFAVAAPTAISTLHAVQSSVPAAAPTSEPNHATSPSQAHSNP
jgi:hypothetical protein